MFGLGLIELLVGAVILYILAKFVVKITSKILDVALLIVIIYIALKFFGVL
jgi:hypothetical protein